MIKDSSGHASNAGGSPEEQTLRYAAQLKGLSQLFLHDLDLREITKSDIDEWEVELRGIIAGIEQLRKAPTIDALITSCDGVKTMLWEAIYLLYIASDISQKENPTIEERKEFYRAFPQCSNLLYCAVDLYFHSSIKALLDN